MSKRLASAIFALLFALTAFVPALAAAETPAPSGAPEAEPSEKEEVIYFNLDASGEVESAYAVNSFPGGDIRDYGDYSEVRVLNTSDEITLDGDEVRLSSDAAKVYYQGTLKDPRLPWDISLTYKLDGKAVSPEELGGKSGSLEIRFTVEKNARCAGSFYEDYALQASFTMPGECCSGVSAPDATVANVGADKQLTFTLLPGEGIDTVISAEVEDFTMPAVSINGVHLNLSVDVDTEDIKDQVGQLVSAAAQLDNGAAALVSGSTELLGGTADVQSGAESLRSGIAELDSGVGELRDGLAAMRDGLNELYAKSPELASGAYQIYAGLAEIDERLSAVDVQAMMTSVISSLTEAAGGMTTQAANVAALAAGLQQKMADAQGLLAAGETMVSNMQATNSAAAAGLQSVLATLDPKSEQYAAAAEAINSATTALNGSGLQAQLMLNMVKSSIAGFSEDAASLESALLELQASGENFKAVAAGLQEQTGGLTSMVDELKSGIAQLVSGAWQLTDGVSAYTSGVAQLVDGFGSVMSGVGQLASGTQELLSGSDTLSAGTAELYAGVAELCDGAESMAAGAGRLHSEAGGVDIQAQVDELLEGIGGSMAAPESFTSEANGLVKSVQFVISCAAIEAPEAEPEPAPQAEEPTLWQRFLALFGIE